MPPVVTERCYDPTHRSYSSDSTFDACQFRYHAQADMGVAFRPNARMIVGSTVDAAIMAALADEPPLDIEHDLRVRTWDAGLGLLDADIEKATRLYDLWDSQVRDTWPDVHSIQPEWHFEVAGVTHHVHPDVVFDDGGITDVKTSEKRLGERRVHEDVQLTTYAYGFRREFGETPRWVGLDGLIYANAPSEVQLEAKLLGRPVPGKPWYDRQRGTRGADTLLALEGDVRRREAARRFATNTGIWQTNGRARFPSECTDCPAIALCPTWVGHDTSKGVILVAA